MGNTATLEGASAPAVPSQKTVPAAHLGLRVGEVVEVRPIGEILETLDEKGRLDALPFMPEMLRFCGKRFRVRASAHKTCDRVEKSGLRRMTNTVHLEDLRCDGASHGGCQAGCLLFWKEAWLRRVDDRSEAHGDGGVPTAAGGEGGGANAVEGPFVSGAPPLARPPHEAPDTGRANDTLSILEDATRGPVDPATPEEVRWSCQATEMFRATAPLKWWDPRSYVRDVLTGNAKIGQVLRWLVIRTFNQVQRIPRTYRLVEITRGAFRYPLVAGSLRRTPRVRLDLSPGDRVRIKSAEEIRATLDTRARNRGLSFDIEMVRYCGSESRVLSRVTRLIDEPTGRMMEPPNDCLILDGVVCTAEYHGLCPRAIYPYWREIWLERTGAAPATTTFSVDVHEAPADTPPAVPDDGSCGQEAVKGDGPVE